MCATIPYMTRQRILILLALAGIIINTLFFSVALVGIVLGITTLTLAGKRIGSYFYTKLPKLLRTACGIVTYSSAIAILSTLSFYIHSFTLYQGLGIFSLLTLGVIFLPDTAHATFTFPRISGLNFGLSIGYLGAAGYSISLLFGAQTGQALFSPWEVVPALFFATYAAATLLLLIFILTHDGPITTVLLSAHTVLSFGVALIVYALSYGYDPFVHLASQKLLLTTGTISPKPPYYIGQYVLVLLTHWISAVDYRILYRLMVPVLTGSIPLFAIPSLSLVTTFSARYIRFGFLLFLLLPLTILINSTPFALTVLLFIFTLLGSLMYLKNPIWQIMLFPAASALFALAVHPLGGIPALLVCVLAYIWSLKIPGAAIIKAIGIVVSACTLPAILLAAGKLGQVAIELSFRLKEMTPLTIPRHFNFLLDITYASRVLVAALILITVIVGLKTVVKKYQSIAGYLISLSGALAISSLLLYHFISFGGVVTEESSIFAQRIAVLGLLSLLMISILGMAELAQRRVQTKSPLILILILVALTTAGLYLRYPRLDDYENAGFISISEADYAAVTYIESQTDRPYLVLANQMSGAAALDTYGFQDRYLRRGDEELYFYPIPTTHPYADDYRAILDNSELERIEHIKSETGVSDLFIILPTNWNRFDHIHAVLEKAAVETAAPHSAIRVYRF